MCISPGSAFQAAGQVVQGISDYNTGNANARISNLEGKSAWEGALSDAATISNQGERFLGGVHSRQAASGVDISSGSAADVSAESARNIELDRLNAIFAGRQKVWAKKIESNIAKAGAKTALATSALKATGTLLAGSGGGGGWPGMGGGESAGISANMMAVG